MLFSAPKVLFVAKWVLFLLKMCFSFLGRVFFFKCFFFCQSPLRSLKSSFHVIKCSVTALRKVKDNRYYTAGNEWAYVIKSIIPTWRTFGWLNKGGGPKKYICFTMKKFCPNGDTSLIRWGMQDAPLNIGPFLWLIKLSWRIVG